MKTRTRAAIQVIESKVAAAALRGVTVQPGYWEDEGHVCLCGAVLVAVGVPVSEFGTAMSGADIIRAVSRRLRISITQAIALNNGFEGAPIHQRGAVGAEWLRARDPIDRVWYRVGRAMRRKWEQGQ